MLVEPLTIAEKSLIQVTADPAAAAVASQQLHAVVLGAGPVGLLGAMTLRNKGFDVTVYSRDREPDSPPPSS